MQIKLNREKINEFLKSDRAILMFCIGIALIFWILVKLSQDFNSSFDINAEYQIPPGKTFVAPPPSALNVSVKGNGWDLMGNYFSTRKKITLKLPDISEYTFNTPVLKDLIRAKLPNSIEVTQVSPEYLQLRLEPKVEKKVPIVERTQLSFAPQYHLKDSIFTVPDSVLVTGPSSLTDTITKWPTKLFLMDNLQNSIDQELELVPPFSPQILLSPDKVYINIPVEQLTEKIIFIPISILNAPDSLKIFPEKVRISSTVGLSNYDSIQKNQFKAEVDFNQIEGANPQNNTLPITLSKFPSLVESIHYTPKSVEYFFVKALDADSSVTSTSKRKIQD